MNPFIRLWEDPTGSLAAFAYAMVLLSALMATWYILGRNLLTMYVQYQKQGWRYTPPAGWMARAIAVPLIIAVDSLLIAALVHVL